MCAAAGGASGGGGSGGGGRVDSKCPLCRTNFTSADVVGGAELAPAEASKEEREEEEKGKGKAGGEEGMGTRTPPPKVAALLQRYVV